MFIGVPNDEFVAERVCLSSFENEAFSLKNGFKPLKGKIAVEGSKGEDLRSSNGTLDQRSPINRS